MGKNTADHIHSALAGAASHALGAERAAALDDELSVRARQLWLLGNAPLSADDEPACRFTVAAAGDDDDAR